MNRLFLRPGRAGAVLDWMIPYTTCLNNEELFAPKCLSGEPYYDNYYHCGCGIATILLAVQLVGLKESTQHSHGGSLYLLLRPKAEGYTGAWNGFRLYQNSVDR